MLLTTKGRYGLRAVFNLVLNGDQPLSLKTIAQREDISESYLEILMGSLKKGGILISTRGAKGGYKLAHRPDEITVGQVLRVLEGSMAAAECVEESENYKTCSGQADSCCTCIIHGALKKLNREINAVLDGMTLQDMLNDYSEGKH